MKQEEIRGKLIQGTIAVIAQDGLDKTTTKQIGTRTGINEVYIYRYFNSKEGLLAKTFEYLDRELTNKILQSLPIAWQRGRTMQERFWLAYCAIWRFLLGNKEKCLAFVRYYYSPYFKKNSYERHMENYRPIVQRISVVFSERANVWMILNHVLNVMLDFSVKVYDERLPDNADTQEHVFRLIYVSTQQYFKNREESYLK